MAIKTSILSVIFPENIKYFNYFLESLQSQTEKNFTLILLNDGVPEIENYFVNFDLNVEIFDISRHGMTIFENRLYGLSQILKKGFDRIIFADTDDFLSTNRVQSSLNYLETYQVICNDITTISSSGILIKQNSWSTRLGDFFEFDSKFINDKNILGFGNSAIRSDLVKLILNKLNKETRGNDWLFFAAIEKLSKALFISEANTYYRQHEGNIIGRKKINLRTLMRIIETKLLHYNLLKKYLSISLEMEIKKNQQLLNNLLKSSSAYEEKINSINDSDINFFWWEESNYLTN